MKQVIRPSKLKTHFVWPSWMALTNNLKFYSNIIKDIDQDKQNVSAAIDARMSTYFHVPNFLIVHIFSNLLFNFFYIFIQRLIDKIEKCSFYVKHT